MFKMFVNWIDAYVWGIHRSIEDKKIAFNLSCYQPLWWCFFSGRLPNCTYTSISRINYRRWRQVGKRWGILKKLLSLLCCAFRLQPLLSLGVDAQNISHGNSGIWNAFLPSNGNKNNLNSRILACALVTSK